MGSFQVIDMTQGNISKLLITFSAPMLAGNIFQQLYNWTDSIIVGNFVDKHALGAVGACNSLNFFFFSLCSGMSIGIGIIIAQYFGAKREEEVKKAIINGFYVIAAVSLIMGTIAFCLARPLLTLMKTPKEYINESVGYLKTISLGFIAVAAYNAVSSMLRALGDSKTPLLFLIISSLINVGLDLLFVIGANMGVVGAAIATVIAQAVSAVGCISFAMWKNPYFRLNKKYRKADKTIIKACIHLGVPVGLQYALIALSSIALQSVANQFGPDVATAYTMTSRIEQIIHQPYSSLAAGISNFTGQNVGAGKLKRVQKGLKVSLIISAVFSALMLVIMHVFGRYILRIFGDEEVILNIAVRAVKITSYFYFPLSLIYMIRGLSNGAGDATYSMMNGIVEVICRVVFSLTLTRITFIGMWGVWLTTGFTWSVTGIASVIRYFQKKWMRKSIVRTV